MIHETAIIDPSAKIAKNASVGAYSSIGKDGISIDDKCVFDYKEDSNKIDDDKSYFSYERSFKQS